MDIAGLHLPTVVSVGGTFATVYTLFSHFDRIQSRPNRQFTSRWLLGLTAPEDKWGDVVLELFVRYFGRKHWSWRCIRRSCALSIFVLGVVFLINTWRQGEFSLDAFHSYKYIGSYVGFVVATAVVATPIVCLSDYLSLWKTRAILTTWLPNVYGLKLITLVLIDFVITTIAYIIAWFLVLLTLDSNLFTREIRFKDNLGEVLDGFVSMIGRDPDSLGSLYPMFYAAATLTSAWLWAYLVVAQFMRGLRYVPSTLRALSRCVDLKEHPVRAIGFFAALISAAIVTVLNTI